MAARLSRCSLGNDGVLKRFRNYCGPIKIARSGFPWEKTTKRPLASVYTNCETAASGWKGCKETICTYPEELHGSMDTIMRSHSWAYSVSRNDRPGATVTLAQGTR